MEASVVKQPCVYIMASARNGTLYDGVTSHVVERVYQPRSDAMAGCTSKQRIPDLVGYELHATMRSAITREKALKEWNRKWKLDLVEASNPKWRDLYPDIIDH